MNRNQILVIVLILILSWTVVAAVTFAITREISEYEPPFGNYYEFDSCLNDQRNLEWCNAYYTAVEDTWDFVHGVYLPSYREIDAGAMPPERRAVLVVVNELFDEQVIYEITPLSDGECPQLDSVEIRFLLNSYVGVHPRISMNDDCEIYLDIPEIK